MRSGGRRQATAGKRDAEGGYEWVMPSGKAPGGAGSGCVTTRTRRIGNDPTCDWTRAEDRGHAFPPSSRRKAASHAAESPTSDGRAASAEADALRRVRQAFAAVPETALALRASDARRCSAGHEEETQARPHRMPIRQRQATRQAGIALPPHARRASMPACSGSPEPPKEQGRMIPTPSGRLNARPSSSREGSVPAPIL